LGTGLSARIEAVDLAAPQVDRARVDAAFSTHLVRLGLPARRVWWEDDVASARPSTTAREAREWWLARSRCRAAAQTAGWRPRVHARRVQGPREADRVLRIAAIWEAVEAVTRDGDPRRPPMRFPRWPNEWLPPNPVAPWLIDAVAWSSAPAPFSRAAAVVRWTEACAALVDAYEAGLGFFWVLVDWIVAVPRPALSVVGGVLHDAAGPAVSWPGGERYWFWRGLPVPRRVVEEPESLTVSDVHDEWNVEVRRVMLERMGFDRYVREAGGRVIAEDYYGRLWRCSPLPSQRWPQLFVDIDNSEPLVFVEVENATPAPDGSARRYFLRVPPTMSTPHEAVAWTFGLSASRYSPSAES
jgi:Domain of unknown function (DUF6745)